MSFRLAEAGSHEHSRDHHYHLKPRKNDYFGERLKATIVISSRPAVGRMNLYVALVSGVDGVTA